MKLTVLAGGFGGAKMAHGFALLAHDPGERGLAAPRPLELSIVGNTADDVEIHGLHVSPDLDTLMYTLAGLANPESGWGLRDETWSNVDMLARYGAPTWFRLGDRDLATQLLRTERLRAGERLTTVTEALADALGVAARLRPATDDTVRTHVRTEAGWVGFQEYFVLRRHADEVRELRFEGAAEARPTREALAAIAEAELLVLAPSNPFVSIGAILAVPGIAEALLAARAPVVAISPIVGGRALRGPADQMFVSLGGDPSALGVARHYVERYPRLLDALVIDRVDGDQARQVEATALAVMVTDTVMRVEADRRRLAAEVLGFADTQLAATGGHR
ncbi:MAG: 2-phospho-L-lactate transferase [Chloroflexota bacterium]|nr:2-phospho-L-lactate transferase [Chloroflexota bacterium]